MKVSNDEKRGAMFTPWGKSDRVLKLMEKSGHFLSKITPERAAQVLTRYFPEYFSC